MTPTWSDTFLTSRKAIFYLFSLGTGRQSDVIVAPMCHSPAFAHGRNGDDGAEQRGGGADKTRAGIEKLSRSVDQVGKLREPPNLEATY